MEARRSA